MKQFLTLLLGITLGIGILGGIGMYQTYDRLYKQCRFSAYDRNVAQLGVMSDLLFDINEDVMIKESDTIMKALKDDLEKCEYYK